MITLYCIRPKGFNVGNDVIFMGLHHFVSEAFGQVVNLISLPATSRYESQAKAGLTARTIHEINQFGHGVIVGGGNLYENGELEINLDALGTLEVPLMLFSLSRGRIYNREHRLVQRTDAMPARTIVGLHGQAQYSLARDKATYAFLHDIGCSQAVLGGCPTLFLDRMTKRIPDLTGHDRNVVLVSVRNPSLMSIPLPQQAQVHGDIRAIIDFLRREGHKDIRLLCHDHRDIPFAASFPEVEFVYTGDVYTYLALLRSCALNVTYRLHSAIPCLAFGIPVIPISYDERGLSMMDTIGFDAWNINMLETPDVLAQVIERYQRLDTLPTQRTQCQPLWAGLHDTMRQSFQHFAASVNAYHAQFHGSRAAQQAEPAVGADVNEV